MATVIARKNQLENNKTIWANLQTEEHLKMYSNKMGMLISLGKTESYVKFYMNNRTYYDFIPNSTMRPFIFKHKDDEQTRN
jgi:hypothetical protein